MKRALTLSTLLLSSFFVQAQVFDSYDVAVSINRMDLIYPSEYDGLNEIRRDGTGFGIGFYGNRELAKNLGLRFGLEFSQKQVILDLEPQEIIENNNLEPTGEFITYSDARTSIYLLSVPANVILSFPRRGFLTAGPVLDFKLGNSTDSYTIQNGPESSTQEEQIFNYAETVHLAYLVGAGKDFNFINTEIQVSLQFRRDISEMIRKDNFISTRRQSIELWVGVPIF